jgi:hypothetical protein
MCVECVLGLCELAMVVGEVELLCWGGSFIRDDFHAEKAISRGPTLT